MEYFLIPGRHPELSAAELWAVAERDHLGAELRETAGAIFISTDRELPAELPSWLGGMVKFGKIIG